MGIAITIIFDVRLSLKHSESGNSGMKRIGVLYSFQNHLSFEDFSKIGQFPECPDF